MRHAESVTFGGSELDRSGALRGDAAALADAAANPEARTVLLWRGKVLIARTRPAHVLRVPLTHPALKDAGPDRVFLGHEDDVPLFAHSLTGWEPDDLDASEMGAFLDPTEQHHPAFEPIEIFAELRRIMTWLSPRDAEVAATAKAVFTWHDSHPFCSKCGAPSQMTQGGWQRTCPACGTHHFPRIDPVVIMLITHGNSVLMGRSPGWPEGMYSLLAGFVEPGETLEAAVRREVFEEAGVTVGAVNYLASQPWPFPASLMIGCRGHATSRKITIDPTEIEDAMWITRAQMMDIFAGTEPTILPARKGAIAHFLIENWLADRLD